jgi:hypothetical protein
MRRANSYGLKMLEVFGLKGIVKKKIRSAAR